jgi:hypothetical protein
VKYQNPYGVSDPVEDAPYINGDPSIARQGSIVPAAAVENPQREIVNFVKSSAMVPTDADLFQLTRAARHQWVNFCVDTGSANALSVALTPPLTAYAQGVPLRVLVKTTNTGPTTINVNGLGNRPVVRSNGSALAADDLRANMIALLVDDGTRFQFVNFLGATGGAATNFFTDIPYAQDTGTINHVIGNYSPPITSAVSGDLVLIRIANVNSGAVDFKVNGLAVAPLVRNDGQPLQQYDLIQNEILLLVYNVSYWQVMRFVRSQVFMKLTADLILYVRPDGDDTNGDGSTNTAAKAFRTVARAVKYISDSWLIGGRTVTIQLGVAGTYTGNQIVVKNLPGHLVIRGDPANIPGYVIQGPASPVSNSQVLYLSGSGIDVTVQGITFACGETAPARSNVLECNYGASLVTDNIALAGNVTTGSGIATWSGQVLCHNYLHTYSGLGQLFFANYGSVTLGQWATYIHNHSVTYSNAFAYAASVGVILIYYGWASFIGSAFGPRYIAIANSVIVTGGGGSSFFPGSAAGSIDGSSVYS